MKKKKAARAGKNARTSKASNVIRRVNPEALYPPNGYTHVVEATGGRTVYISGQVPTDAKGNVVGAGDFGFRASSLFNRHSRASGNPAIQRGVALDPRFRGDDGKE